MESAHNSASHTSQLCPVASLQPWALETQKYTGGGYELLEKSIILLLCFPRLFITAKKISAAWQEEGVAVAAALVQNTQALVEEPCGLWAKTWCFSTARFYLQRARSLQGVLCAPPSDCDSQQGWGTSFRIHCTRSAYTTLHWRISQEFQSFLLKPNQCVWPITKHWEISYRKDSF